MLPEIWNATEIIFCHLAPFFALWPSQQSEKIMKKFWKNEKNAQRYHFTCVYHIWKSYDIRVLRYGARQTEFFLILDHFLPFYPPKNPEKQNFEKNQKRPGDTIILHKCNINDNYMMYVSWDMKYDRYNSVILDHFFALLPH